MKREYIIDLAFKNLLTMKKNYIVIMLCYTVITVTITCFGAYRNAIFRKTDNIIRLQASNCVIYTDKPVEKDKYEQVLSRLNRYDWPSGRSPEGLVLTYNDKVFQGQNLYNFYFVKEKKATEDKSNYSVPFGITAILPEDDELFPENQITEMMTKTKSASPVKYGNKELDVGKILITDYMLLQFGITEQQEIVGKKITIKDKNSGVVYIDALEVVGVINSDIYTTHFLSQNMITGTCLSQIIIKYDDCPTVMKNDMAIHEEYNKQLIAENYELLDEYPHMGKKLCGCYLRTFSDYYVLTDSLRRDGYQITASDTMEMYYGISQQNIVVDSVISIIIMALVVSLLLFVVTAMYFYHLRHFKYRQMLRALGMKMKDVFYISLIELISCVIVSVVLGMFLSLGIFVLFNLYLSEELYVSVDLNSWGNVCLFAISFVCLVAFSVVASALSLLNLRKTPISVSLNSE